MSGEQAFIDLFERPDDPPYYGSNHLLISHVLHKAKFEECVNEVGVLDGRIFKKRYAASLYQRIKNGNFALQYNAVNKEDGTGTADRTYGIPGAQTILEGRFVKQKRMSDECIRFAEKHGYVETLPDRRVDPLHGYPLMCTRTQWGRIKPTVPLSYKVQGTAMWCTCTAMPRIQDVMDEWNRQARSLQYWIAIQQHDEMVFDFPKRGHPLKDPARSNLARVRELQRIMEDSGENLIPRVPTPTSCEYHETTWAEGVSV